jgi:hypothetical protein
MTNKQTSAILEKTGCKDMGDLARKYSPTEIAILVLVQKKPRSLAKLQDELQNQTQTVYGAAQFLCRAGILSKTERSPKGKYYLK